LANRLYLTIFTLTSTGISLLLSLKLHYISFQYSTLKHVNVAVLKRPIEELTYDNILQLGELKQVEF